MSLLHPWLSKLSLGFYHREIVYRARTEGTTFQAFADRPSMLYPDLKYLVLSLRGMPKIAPEWGFVGQDLPYRDEVYGAAAVQFFDTSSREIQLPPAGDTWQQQRRMIYFDRALYSAAQFAQFARILEAELSNLYDAIIHGENRGIQRMALYKIVGVAYGTVQDFTEIYRDANHALSILPDGAVMGMESVSSKRDPEADSEVQIVAESEERVNLDALSELRSDRTGRRLRDDFPIVIEGYDAASLSFLPPRIWSRPA